MRLDGIHHITCITADGPANVDFYVSVMGLRLVKKTVNFDVPNAYHLYFGDESGSPGSILTFFEYPDAAPGRAGAGMIHRLLYRVRDEATLSFWEQRLRAAGIRTQASESALYFEDPEGLNFGLVSEDGGDEPLSALSDDIPRGHRLRGFGGVRAFHSDSDASEELLVKTMGFSSTAGEGYLLEGDTRTSTYAYDRAPAEAGVQGAGSVHHIAWACAPSEQPEWRERVAQAGRDVTEIIDRKYFRSIYFREPSGVLFEIATIGPGFTVDEPMDRLGEELSLPEWHESRRSNLEAHLTPIRNPRSAGRLWKRRQ